LFAEVEREGGGIGKGHGAKGKGGKKSITIETN